MSTELPPDFIAGLDELIHELPHHSPENPTTKDVHITYEDVVNLMNNAN